jgi:zinc protease
MVAMPEGALRAARERGRAVGCCLRPLALALACLLAAAGQASAATKASHFTLANGLEVVVVPDRRVPIVTEQVVYKAGGADDPDGQPGVAHFLEHLMFKGTDRFPGNSFERFSVVNGGASINAYTTQDYTVYPQSLPKRHLAELMDREADRMANLQITEAQVASELRVVMNERRGNENSPAYLLGDAIDAALYPGHPYGRSVIGTEAQIATLDRAKALAFYKRYYAPNNAILVVAGDVTEDEVRTLAEQTFGRIPAKADLAPRVIHRLPREPAERRVELQHERVTTPSIGFYYPTPGVGALPRKDAYALDLLTRIAGTSIIGRFYRALVLEQRLALSVSASHSLDVQAGLLSFTATAAPGVSAADFEAAFRRQIDALARKGVTKAEADDARQAYLAAKAYEDDNHRQRAGLYARALARGLTIADVEAADAIMAKVSVADVNRVAARFVGKVEPVVGVLRPRSVEQAAGPAPAAK